MGHSKSVINTEVSLFQGCPIRGVALYIASLVGCRLGQGQDPPPPDPAAYHYNLEKQDNLHVQVGLKHVFSTTAETLKHVLINVHAHVC